jgi:citrate synthase
LSFAANLWLMLGDREPPGWLERVLDALLILCAEHGFTPATIAVRMAGASGADFSSALLAGLSIARGPHAAGSAVEALGVLGAVRTADRASAWVRTMLERQGSVAGFRHRAYRVGDPRTEPLSSICRRVAERTGRMEREELASAVEQAVWDQVQLLPALNWPISRVLDNLGIEQDLFVPLYTISRLAGWTAHYAEQRQQGGTDAIPSKYVGEPLRHHRPMNERT